MHASSTMMMKLNRVLIIFFLLLSIISTTPSHSQSCKSSCGPFPIHYPFGTGPGCGSPAFQPHITCDEHRTTLVFTTPSGSYPVQSIDYTNQILYIHDPSISTCTLTTPSQGFSLDRDAPFSFVDGNIFVLLGCSNSSTTCDVNAPICSLLYTCPAIAQLGSPMSTCCIYSPVSLGPAFDMDLRKLECSSYSGLYSFGGAETDPSGWKFGIAIKYRFSVDDGYPSACADCEKSNGVCGFGGGGGDSFTCNCVGGTNTTSNCYFARYWSSGAAAQNAELSMGEPFIRFIKYN